MGSQLIIKHKDEHILRGYISEKLKVVTVGLLKCTIVMYMDGCGSSELTHHS
jgi:hypothetical protein